jgi:ABC-type multidrug transport system fused ATPase/permease subunit
MTIDQDEPTTTVAELRANSQHVSFGMPMERSSNAGSVTRRLAVRMKQERGRLALVFVLASVGAFLSVLVPDLLGHATDTVVSGLSSPQGIDTSHLKHLLELAAGAAIGAATASFVFLRVIAGVVQRTMQRLRADVEAKLYRLPLSFVDAFQQRHLRRDRRRWRAPGRRRCDHGRHHPGVHPVLPAVHPAAHPRRSDVIDPAVGARLGRASLRVARCA